VKALRRSSGVLFVLAALLLVIAVVATIKLLVKIALVVLLVSLVLTMAKRSIAKRSSAGRRQT